MPTRNRWIVSSIAGLFLAAVAGLVYAAATEADAAGGHVAEASDEAPQVRHSQIKLVLDRDGTAEQLELADLHELAVGESRNFTTASGTPVVVTRDAAGFEIDLDGKKIRLTDHFAAEMPEGSWTSEGGETHQLHKRIVVNESAEGGDGSTNVTIVRNKVVMDEDGAVIAGGDDSDHDVIVMRRGPGSDAHSFAFATAGGDMPVMPVSVETTIERLEASAKFQALDAATRATVIEALRESAPKSGLFFVGEPGSKSIVLEVVGEDDADDAN